MGRPPRQAGRSSSWCVEPADPPRLASHQHSWDALAACVELQRRSMVKVMVIGGVSCQRILPHLCQTSGHREKLQIASACIMVVASVTGHGYPGRGEVYRYGEPTWLRAWLTRFRGADDRRSGW
jgi:hypothetical protein